MTTQRPALLTNTPYLLLLLLLCLVVGSCKKKEERGKLPKALVNKSVDVSDYSRRSDKDMLESLYDEIKEQSQTLQQLESEIAALNKSSQDSISAFNHFENKSFVYYDAANKHLASIKDSLLRLRMQKLIDSSMLHYKSLIAPDTALIATITKRQASLQDMYAVIKIVKTLPVMEDYQKGYLPADSIFQNLLERYNALLLKADSISKK